MKKEEQEQQLVSTRKYAKEMSQIYSSKVDIKDGP